MKVLSQVFNVRLAAAGMAFSLCAHSALAGYTASVQPNGVGQVSAGLTNAYGVGAAGTPMNYTLPSAGVTTAGTWVSQASPPPNSGISTSTVSTVYLYGYKAVARSWNVGTSADNPGLSKKLADEGYTLTPNLCGAGYNIASGDEIINGNRYLVVLGNGSPGSAAWFRGYIFNGTPSSRDDIVAYGTKLYEAVVMGPFDFGDPNSPDRCNALKIPINYAGPNVYFLSDGIAESATDLQFVNAPASWTINCGDPVVYPALETSGGCGAVSITFSPPINQLGAGTTVVTATATDSSGYSITAQFPITLPAITVTPFAPPFTQMGGTCGSPAYVANAGNKIPIKFDTSCDGAPFQSSVPPAVTITKYTNCVLGSNPTIVGQFQWVANEWHFNWNTQKKDAGTYLIDVSLGGGSPDQWAVVKLQ